MDSLYDALLKRMQTAGQSQAFTAAMILDSANRVLPQDLRAKVFHNEALTLEAETGAKAYFYKEDAESLLEQINAALGQPVVKTLKIRIQHQKRP
jgi:hypothetical protein